MKKQLGLFLIAAGLSTGAYGQKHTGDVVPSAVKEAFARQFPATDARWEKLGDQYGAYFRQRP